MKFYRHLPPSQDELEAAIIDARLTLCVRLALALTVVGCLAAVFLPG